MSNFSNLSQILCGAPQNLCTRHKFCVQYLVLRYSCTVQYQEKGRCQGSYYWYMSWRTYAYKFVQTVRVQNSPDSSLLGVEVIMVVVVVLTIFVSPVNCELHHHCTNMVETSLSSPALCCPASKRMGLINSITSYIDH